MFFFRFWVWISSGFHVVQVSKVVQVLLLLVLFGELVSFLFLSSGLFVPVAWVCFVLSALFCLQNCFGELVAAGSAIPPEPKHVVFLTVKLCEARALSRSGDTG